MNPHAKEFVPAHIMKRRQEEANELTNKVAQVGLEDLNGRSTEHAETSSGDGGECDRATNSNTNPESKDNNTDQSSEQQPHRSNNNQPDNHHYNNTNDSKQDLGRTDEDRHLLKAGETYCEFNGEQFIIPGEDDDEYEPEQFQDYDRKAGYDFGNAEDNEDEDVCLAYEKFLHNLPE